MTARPTALLLHPRDDRPHAPAYQGLLDVLARSAAGAVAGAGYEVTVLATEGRTTADVLAAARAADVVVLLGGEDVDPALYGGPAEYPGGGMHEPGADRVAVEVIRDAVAPALCTHHQAVADLGAGLVVLARAADGTVEAVAHPDAPVLGVQWHPEHPDTAAAQLPILLDRLRARAHGAAV